MNPDSHAAPLPRRLLVPLALAGGALVARLPNLTESIWYDETYYRTSPRRNPKGPAEGTHKVVRGGAWNYDPHYVRSALRLFYDPSCRGFYVGFRCAKDIESHDDIDTAGS